MRFTPLPADEWDDRVSNAFDGVLPRERRNPHGAGNALATLARHPELLGVYLPLANYLQARSTLPPRIRELVVLRVAHRTGCVYEWTHHVEIGRRSGLSEDEIAGATAGRAEDLRERLVLAATDELLTGSVISDETWSALGNHFDDHQRMDLVFTVGGYVLLALGLNTFGVVPEDKPNILSGEPGPLTH